MNEFQREAMLKWADEQVKDSKVNNKFDDLSLNEQDPTRFQANRKERRKRQTKRKRKNWKERNSVTQQHIDIQDIKTDDIFDKYDQLKGENK